MTCPLCQKRKAKRFCPARGDQICSVCCGTEREVTIDCAPDCPHLVESRRHDEERREYDWSKLPFPEYKIPSSFVRDHGSALNTLSLAICNFADQRREVVDQDAIAALTSLAETYVTLSKGLVYEKRPASLLQGALYEALRQAITDLKTTEARESPLTPTRDGDLRDALVVLTQLGARHDNGRPRSRAFLHLLRREIRPKIEPGSAQPASRIIIP